MKNNLFSFLLVWLLFQSLFTHGQIRPIGPIDDCINCRPQSLSVTLNLRSHTSFPINVPENNGNVQLNFDGFINNDSRSPRVDFRLKIVAGGQSKIGASTDVISSISTNQWTGSDGYYMYTISGQRTLNLRRSDFPSGTTVASVYIQAKVGTGSSAGQWKDGISFQAAINFTNPNASFVVNPATINEGESVSLSNTSTNTLYGLSASTYAWSFPGGSPSSSTALTPSSVTYNTAGTYTMSLTVNKPGAGSSTTTRIVTVNTPIPPPPIPSNFSRELTGPDYKPMIIFRWSSLGSDIADGYRIYHTAAGSRYPQLIADIPDGNARHFIYMKCNESVNRGCVYIVQDGFSIRGYNSGGQIPHAPFNPRGNIIEGGIIFNEPTDITFYPNPTSSSIRINLSAEDIIKKSTNVELFDLNGTLVLYREKLIEIEGIIDLDVSQLEVGDYILKINGRATRVKIEH